jgi:hypothetical protein
MNLISPFAPILPRLPKEPNPSSLKGNNSKRPRWSWGIIAILAGYLLVSHGCHRGNEDHELFLIPFQIFDRIVTENH